MVMKTNVRELLREMVNESGLSRYRIAKLAGIAEDSLHRFMHAKKRKSADVLQALVDYFDLELVPRKER